MAVAGDADRSFSASFELQGGPKAGSLTLSGPIGSRIGQAQWADATVQLLQADAPPRRYADLASLTTDLLGEPLPVLALFAWLSGQPDETAPFERWSADRGAGFDQLGWSVATGRRDAGLLVVQRIMSPPQVTIRVKLDGR